MSSFRVRAVRTTIAVGLGLLATSVAERPLRASEAERLLEPTPLVLKDGRIASVSIHTVPFARGRAELTGQAAARVAELTRAVATDCFLTAQVIGHIDSSEIAQDATLDAHRLARSRADAVQASLIGGGLPAKSIASVWDWQFMVRAPRVTLWIFQLTAGEDCEGRALDGALVAQATPSNPRTATQPEPAPTPAERTASPAARAPVASADRSARAAEPPPERPKAEPRARAEAPGSPPAWPAAQTERASPAEPAEPPEKETAVAARPALAPKTPTSDGNAEQPAQPPATGTATVAKKPASAAATPAHDGKGDAPAKQRESATAVAAKPAAAARAPASDGKVERAAAGSLVITFATNSSWFPSGTSRRLRQLIAGIEPGGRYQVNLKVAVSASTKVVGARTAEEAARYNKWLAERRLERVQNWLREHAAAALTFEPEYVTDESRQVIVELAPVG